MARAQLNGVLSHLRQAVGASGAGGPTDAELLERFVARRDHAAFELLVWRHGAMVLQTCRRLLARPEDAEDAFQATFLALVRRAKSIKRGHVVAGWLYTVACRAALRVRSAAARRAAHEGAMQRGNGAEPVSADGDFDPLAWAEVRTLIDHEVSRLSAKLRDPFILCCLEGLTNEEAARQLGCPRGTVLSRLSRARERLRGRLTRRGIGLPATAFAAALTQEAAAAPLVISTVKAAILLAAGQATASVVSAPVAVLTEGVIRAMFLTKMKMIAATVVVIGAVAAGSGGAIHLSTATAQVAKKEPAAKARPADNVDANRAAQAQAQVDMARIELAATHQLVQQLHDQLRRLEADLKTTKDRYELARAHLDKVVQEAKQATPPAKSDTKAPPATDPASKQPNPAAATEKTVIFPSGASLDLIQLANSYVDAVREMETAKVHATPFASFQGIGVSGVSQEQRAIKLINLKAAERKVQLLKAIIEGSLRGAENEAELARRQHASGIASLERVNAARTKIDVLRLILESAK